MSTSLDPLEFLWEAIFTDGSFIVQPKDDRYSKHVEGAEYNPTAFRDIQDKLADGLELDSFILFHRKVTSVATVGAVCAVFLRSGIFEINHQRFSLEQADQVPLRNRKLIFHRVMQMDSVIQGTVKDDLSVDEKTINKNPPRVIAYEFGYEGYDISSKKIIKKVIRIDG